MASLNKKDLLWGLLTLVLVAAGLTYAVKNNKINFSPKAVAPASALAPATGNNDPLLEQVIPASGVKFNVKYGDIGPKLIASGAIDLEKLKKIYQDSGNSLSQAELDILINGSEENIVLGSNNSHFLLNLFWALGLANKNQILDEGQMVKYGGREKAGNFASTGGWTLAKGDPSTGLGANAMDYYSKFEIVKLTDEQQKIVEEVAANVYRPCCNNSTAFPDCNHGMAALAVIELMASQGAGEQEIYQAIKYFNSYWFAQTYYEMALYFKNKEGKDWQSVDAKTVLGFDYSSASGAQKVHQYLKDKNLLKSLPGSGGGCGV